VSGLVNTSYQVGSALGLAAATALRGLVRRHRELPGGIGDRRRGRGCCRAPPARRDPPPVDGGRATRRRGAAAGARRLISGMRSRQRWTARQHHSPIRFTSPRSRADSGGNDDPDARSCRSGPMRWPRASWCRWPSRAWPTGGRSSSTVHLLDAAPGDCQMAFRPARTTQSAKTLRWIQAQRYRPTPARRWRRRQGTSSTCRLRGRT
jgi:hypothetical protein